MTAPKDGGPAFPQTTFEELRDYFAAQEQLSEFDHLDAILPKKMAEALAGRPMPEHGWGAKTDDECLSMLQWEADWRSALKYMRANAMLAARERGQS